MTEEQQTICGIPVRVSDILPQDIIAMSGGCCITFFWQGTEVGRLLGFRVTEGGFLVTFINSNDSIRPAFD